MHDRTDNTTWRTLDGDRPTDGVVFVVGSNLPGYLPDSEPYVVRNLADAFECMVADADSHADFLADDMPGADVDVDIECIRSAIADGDARFDLQRTGAVDFVVGADHGFGGRVFFVHARALDVVGPGDDSDGVEPGDDTNADGPGADGPGAGGPGDDTDAVEPGAGGPGADVRPVGCECPADHFFRLDGYHVCDDGAESFRRGYCADCDDVIEREGLCGHGSYPDSCGSADSVVVVEWTDDDGATWHVEREPIDGDSDPSDLYRRRKIRDAVVDLLASVYEDCPDESGGLYALDVDADVVPGYGVAGDVVDVPSAMHADGVSRIRARVRRGSLAP